jgi:hypothetical protein
MGRYRLTGGLRLPRFGKRKSSEKRGLMARQVELPIGDGVTVKDSAGVAGGGPKGSGKERRREGWWLVWGRGLARWWQGLMEPSARRRPPRRQPVQTALLLASVKVVRNDLMDSDLEVVRLRKRRRAASSVVRPASGAGSGGGIRSGLGRTAMRWLTAGRTS